MNSDAKKQEIIDKLKSSEIDPQVLKDSAEVAASLYKFGLKDVFIYGIVKPNGTSSKFHVPPKDLSDFFDEISKLNSNNIDLEVFPIGIKAPELYEVNLRYGVKTR